MPIYEYECKKCNIIYDLKLPIVERNYKQYCVKCKIAMNRKYSGIKTGLLFGKGFFNTGGY